MSRLPCLTTQVGLTDNIGYIGDNTYNTGDNTGRTGNTGDSTGNRIHR